MIKIFSRKKTLGQWLSKFDLKELSINAVFLKSKITFKDNDREAAWEMYIELLTRITTQPLPDEDGVEKTALDSVYAIFPITREVLKKYGGGTIQFSKIAIPVLNQIVRPFTAKWHKLSEEGAFNGTEKCKEFRDDLEALQIELKKYNRLLADIAGVEDLTALEKHDE